MSAPLQDETGGGRSVPSQGWFLPRCRLVLARRPFWLLFGVALAWLVALHVFLVASIGPARFYRSGFYFNADHGEWPGYLRHGISAVYAFDIRHPGVNFVWRAASRGVFGVLSLVLPAREAGVLSALSIVLCLAAAGGACLFVTSPATRIKSGAKFWLLFAVFLLFSSQVIVCIPDHFGCSLGLLSGTYFLFCRRMDRRRKVACLVLATLLCGVTTVTNALFPALCIGAVLCESVRCRRAVRAAGVAVLAVVPALILVAAAAAPDDHPGDAQAAPGIPRLFKEYRNNRIAASPVDAVRYSLFGIVAPAVAPSPHRARDGSLTYEPVPDLSYGALRLSAAAAWVVLLALSGYAAWRRRELRVPLLVLLSWIMANLLLHNLWGDEFFLYTPHWSWALAGIVVLGIEDVPDRLALPAFTIVLLGQGAALVSIALGAAPG
jgi:hypothetical protein